MRIGHFAFNPLDPGGIASYIRRLATAQAQRGDEIVLLSRDPVSSEADAPFPLQVVGDGDDLFRAATDANLDVLHLHRPVSTLPSDRPPTVRTMHDNGGSCPSGTTFLARTGRPCDRAFSLPGCVWGHLVDHCGSRRPQNLVANMATIYREQDLAAALPTMTVSQYVRTAMIRSGAAPEHLHVVPSPAPLLTDPITPPPRDGRPRLAYVGRIEPNKGVDWFLRAVARCPEVDADIAGTGDAQYVAFIERRIADLGLSDRVTYHGWLSEAAVYALYRGARAVVVPSLWHEPAGLVTLEAAAMGRPVIASRVGGIPEYADPAFARFCDPGDVAALAHHASALCADWGQAWAMGQAGRALVQTRFAFDTFLRNVDAVYERATALSSPVKASSAAAPAAG